MGLLELIGGAGGVLKKVSSTNGGEYAGPCPSCGGRDRFRVWPADKGGRGSYWCRGCGKAGDDVQFLVDFRGCYYREAFRAAGRSMPDNYRPAGYRPVSDGRNKEFRPRTYEEPVETWRMKAEEFVDKSHQALLENKKVLGYVAGRGLDLQAVKGFRLGWFQGEKGKDCMFRPREAWGLPVIKKTNGKKKMLWIPRGIVIPCFKDGRIYRIRIRRPGADLRSKEDIKYYAVPGSGQDVMGHNPDHKAFVVVESELDEMMIARQAGSITGSVALGSAAIKPGSGVFYRLKKALRILVALDYDEAGRKASKWWLDNFDNARRWPVPQGKDPGEAFRAGVAIKEWILAGLPPALTLETYTDYKIPEEMYPLQELQMLLSKYPVKIHAEETRAEILFDPGFQNRAIRQRIRDLFFGDDEIHWYLRVYHKDSIIHGGNCKSGKEWMNENAV
ncbi:primase-helicase zinc-binding domain-containing protein [Desulfobacula toluolica]|nr:primase-helicase zinc-binding domain-containing protein [Desulfobacula toluolica]